MSWRALVCKKWCHCTRYAVLGTAYSCTCELAACEGCLPCGPTLLNERDRTCNDNTFERESRQQPNIANKRAHHADAITKT